MIPIFIITCDRLEVLRKSIESYRNYIKTPFEIVIVDFGSTYKPTVAFLKRLEKRGIKIYWKDKINIPTELNNANKCIKDYFKNHPESNYVVTDPDIALDNVKGDILDVYSYLLNIIPQVKVVSPMLRIDDIPDYYPLRKNLLTGRMGRYHRGFHSKKRHTVIYKGNSIRFITARSDTTFGMFRKGFNWRRLTKGIRIFSPYAARHLDWYIDPKKLTEDQEYYMKHAGITANWSRWKR